jgi:hypothetical protein
MTGSSGFGLDKFRINGIRYISSHTELPESHQFIGDKKALEFSKKPDLECYLQPHKPTFEG